MYLETAPSADQLVDAEGTVLELRLAALENPAGSEELGQRLSELGLLFNLVRIHVIIMHPGREGRENSIYKWQPKSDLLLTARLQLRTRRN
jgi:hypothetical protein